MVAQCQQAAVRGGLERSYFALGWGSHIVWIDPDNDLVTVLRWIDRKQAPQFVERLLGAIA